MKPALYVEYSSNNSGGRWWLTDQNWKDLEAAGWRVNWNKFVNVYKDGEYVLGEDGLPLLVEPTDPRADEDDLGVKFYKGERWLDSLAQSAYRVGLSLREAVAEWERITGLSSTDAGCACCGQPHSFTEYRDGKWSSSGPEASYVCSW